MLDTAIPFRNALLLRTKKEIKICV